MPLARVVMNEASEEPRHEWKVVALAAFGMPRAAIEAELEKSSGKGGAYVAWCS